MDEEYRIRLSALATAARGGDVRAYGRLVELTRPMVEAAVRRVDDRSPGGRGLG